jgi:hypothetical protein
VLSQKNDYPSLEEQATRDMHSQNVTLTAQAVQAARKLSTVTKKKHSHVVDSISVAKKV